MRIDVWSDILCPFCHLGRRHLELALEQFEHGDEVGVVWHSFQLDRTAPAVDDTPAVDRVAQKYGVPREQMVAQHERMAADAAAVGLDFQWESAARRQLLRRAPATPPRPRRSAARTRSPSG